MAEDVSSQKFVCFRVFFYLCLAHLSSASCENNAVGIADGSVYLNASSQHSASTPANNGRLNYTAGSSWCASTSDSNPYLQINLQTLFIICAISTQGNSQADQWVKNYTLQSSTDGTNWTVYREHGQSNKKIFKGNYDRNSAVKHILYNGIVARYVRFIVESNHGGACLRVEIFGVPRSKVNIALLKPTSQSSREGSLFSSYAVDGVKSSDYRQCTHTEDNPATTDPWWRVDLQSEQPVAEVRILNRGGQCCAGRLDGAEIRVGNSAENGGSGNHLCDSVNQIPAGQEKSYFCIPRAYGRYVYIRIPGSGKILTLCEVEVYSTYISRTNLALRQPAQQISIDHSGAASRAVDGRTLTVYSQGSCTHTTETTDPWWRVDLGSSVPVTEVVIVNRGGGDCVNGCELRLNSFEIRIGNRNQSGGETNPSCGGTLSLSGGQTKSFYCKPVLVGRFVFVRIPGSNKVLTLCEVEVYSTTQSVKGCSSDPVGISDRSVFLDQRFSASSTRGSSNPYDGRLTGSNAWLPSTNGNGNDFLQIDLGSVYFVCGVATQGNPSADDWTKTYKIGTSLNNVNWTIYVEDNVEKIFTGNSDKNSVVRSELYEPVAAKFIRFYPVLFNDNKALRVEVYGSLQGCLSSIGNERPADQTLGITASSELDANHRAGWSPLYGLNSWCSASVSLPQYLQFDAKKVITVSGVATQGDNVEHRWVTNYAISYGYDGQKWFDYSSGRVLTGNIDKGSIAVNLLSSPFAAQYIRILPKTFETMICMRVDLLVCENFQVPFLFVELDDAVWSPSSAGSVTLTCAANFSKQRPPAQIYEWQKDGTLVPGSSSSLTVTYTNATDIRHKYRCARKSSSLRDVYCNATYQCSASLVDLPQIRDDAKGNLTVILKVPGKPVVQVNQADIQARSALVRWSYTPGIDETPVTSFALQYRNSTVTTDIDPLPGDASSTQLNDLRPYTTYSVSMTVTSDLGTGEWSNAVNFRTSTDIPEVSVQVDNVTGVTSRSIYVKWTQPSLDKLNGPLAGYTIAYREEGTSINETVDVPDPATSHIIQNLNIWTKYFVNMRVRNSNFPGPWSPEKETRTHQDAPSEPQNLQFNLRKPTENTRPRMTVTWGKPAEENGVIKRYTLVYSYNYDGNVMSSQNTTNKGTLSYSLDVLGGLRYNVTVRAETIKPGPNATGTLQVPEYRPSIAPQNIKSLKINETTYKISWDPLSREKSNGDVAAYEVEWNSSSNAEGVGLQNTTEAFAVLHGLSSCSTYKVKVRAYTSAGPGIFGSLPVDIVTTAPGPPTDVRIENTEKTAVTLRWNKPALHGDDVQKYTVIYEGTKDYFPLFKRTGKEETGSLTLTVQDLYPGTKYNFLIIATTHCGPGKNSSMVSSETPKAAPPTPVPPERIPDLTVTDLSVNVTVRAAPQNNGPISFYQVLVHLVKESTDTVSDWTKLGSDLYIAAQIPFGDVNPSLVFAVGDGREYGGFVNEKLSSGQKYNIYSRALTSKSKKRSTEDQFLVSEAVLIAKIVVKKVTTPIPTPTAKEQGGSPTAAIAASVVVVLILVLVAAVVGVIFWRRRRRPDERGSKSSETHAMTAVNVNGAYDTLVPDGGASRESTPKGEEPDAEGDTLRETSEPIYGNTAPEEADDTPKPIPVSQFSEYVTRLKRDKNAGFASQYKLLVTGQQFAWDVAKKPENKSKNRYGNIIAYDHSRVVLPLIEGVEHSDYHNANYLDGYDGTPKTYIACQGPVPGTFQDFWRMIWLENVSTIVMLTRLVEHGRTKCHQYWPENSETYHDITVTNHKTETFADYAIRTFVLCQNGSEKRRQVQQFHFLVWPDKGVPRHATAVLGLRRKVRAKHTDNKAPLVVHCSAGVGRTGAFVVIDAMMESAQNKKNVDVFNYVQLVRKNRISMVQTEEQYGFIYMALLEALTCGNTEVPAHDIRIAVKKLAAVNPKTKLSGLASEYQRLDLITADDVADREDEVGRRPQNAAKNRFSDIVPLDGSRVFLKGDEKNNYINASFVDTFRERNAFIMTQAPMDNTIQDFWKMVWDYNVGTIVMLNEQNEKGQVYPIYWPSEGSATFGEFVITTTSHEVFQDFSEREFTLAQKKNPNTVRHVQHYQVTGWPDKGIPKNAHCILDLINMVERAQRKTKNAPVVVQCSDGVGRSGTFCAILSIIERLKSEQVIDVLQSVKVIRVNRPRAVNSKAQYVFCYNIVQKYLDSFNDYANFN